MRAIETDPGPVSLRTRGGCTTWDGWRPDSGGEPCLFTRGAKLCTPACPPVSDLFIHNSLREAALVPLSILYVAPPPGGA